MPSSSTIDPDHGAAVEPSRPRTGRRHGGPEDFPSFLRTQDKIDAICKEHGVPEEFTARPAGDLRANSTPPPGAICVCSRALEAGMRVPVQGFFCEALAHFGIAPTQLTPNGWRMMAGFLELCHSVGVTPSLAVFRRFFLLSTVSLMQKKGWYFFRSRDISGLRFTGMPSPNLISFKYWKHEFFFLSSPDSWLCPVEWGEPSKSSLENPVLTGDEKKSAAKLLRAHGGAAVDLRAYLSNSNLEAAVITTTLPPPPSPSSTCTISSPEVPGLDPSVYDMMKIMLVEKAAASLKKVKAEPSNDAPGSPPSYGKKRSLQEANGEEGLSSGVRSPPPGFSPKPQNFSSGLDRDTTDREPAGELLQGAVAPPKERVFTGNEPSDAVASSYAVILQATHYALELEEKLLAQERDAAALREQLEEAKSEAASAKRDAEQEKAKAELAKAKAGLAVAEAEVVKANAELIATKRAADAAEQEKARPELDIDDMEGAEVAKAMAKLAAAKRVLEEELYSANLAAVHQLLCCEEHARRRAEHALDGYHRWRTGRAA